MARGNGRMPIFLDDHDYRKFVHLLGEAVDDSAMRCWNYCLMPNHYHVTLEPTRPNISAAIRRLNGCYAQWWNKRHERVGHVFQGRFKDQVVDRDGYLRTLSRYVVMNPVRAGLVARPDEWPWSSFRATMGICHPPPFLAASSTLRLFGEADDTTLQERFAQFVLAQPDDWETVDRIRSNESILGGRAFKELVSQATIRSDPGLTPV